MENLTTFVLPKNEATVKLYTEDSKITGVQAPVILPKNFAMVHLNPMIQKKLTQFKLHYPYY